ncbi:MAG TPA: DUF4276 family protein [Candidatus Paceibacterota bacterium]|nr:DUF4276 family protein [Verrucomicrobiota bacterium]HRZ46611.1 DUF4276 family protein [Candidatus Paceibacterota bacterium]
MKAFLEEYLPRAFPKLPFLCVRHEGTKDLEASIPRKLRAWREPGVRFVVLRDNHGADCRVVKNRLTALCQEGKREDSLVRIVCQELESWHLGAPAALAEAFQFPALVKRAAKPKFADPDRLTNAAQELGRLVPDFRKIEGARRMGRSMPTSSAANRSKSFRVFCSGLSRLSAETE